MLRERAGSAPVGVRAPAEGVTFDCPSRPTHPAGAVAGPAWESVRVAHVLETELAKGDVQIRA